MDVKGLSTTELFLMVKEGAATVNLRAVEELQERHTKTREVLDEAYQYTGKDASKLAQTLRRRINEVKV